MQTSSIRAELGRLHARGSLAEHYLDTECGLVCRWSDLLNAYVYPDGMITWAFVIRDDFKLHKNGRRFREAKPEQMDLGLNPKEARCRR
jgi:hypothetical protein